MLQCRGFCNNFWLITFTIATERSLRHKINKLFYISALKINLRITRNKILRELVTKHALHGRDFRCA